MEQYATPQGLNHRQHSFDNFTSPSEAQTEWARKHAVSSNNGNFLSVYVTTIHGSDDVVGFYGLCAGALTADQAPGLAQGGGGHDIPIYLLTRLAVHDDHQRQGLGKHLLLDAMRRTVALAAAGGAARALALHCENEEARAFYMHIEPGFYSLPGDPLDLVIPVNTLCAALR